MCVTRWPAKTVFPRVPGTADPGQWPGPQWMADSSMPSKIGCTMPIFGMLIIPKADGEVAGCLSPPVLARPSGGVAG
ncbi:MAG TPA: hypothetical protein VFS16_12415 [Acidimicrobiia bacterium]|nr:hypothetical protein [Acidimicrobiia bacterium]